MKINELSGLYVVKNENENFTILVTALDYQEAIEIAKGYFIDSGMNYEELSVRNFSDINTQFDCDYIITQGQ
ncbi:hypothetical protein [Phocaeicola sp.]|jgi:hypothetical protein|uniref:hypothetical protein n=1 Tax=Phocaeicola sp. TaxID=2773926 RepID=UPI003AF0B265